MRRHYDDDFGFASEDVFAAAINAAELAEILRSPEFEALDDWSPPPQDSDFDLDGALVD